MKRYKINDYLRDGTILHLRDLKFDGGNNVIFVQVCRNMMFNNSLRYRIL
jgi:hypothetical protein